MKKWSLYFAMLCSISAAVHAQKLPIIRPVLKNDIGIQHLPPLNKNGCPATCPSGMKCDGPCCMYPTGETIGQLNYIIYNKCNPIKNLHFKFEVTKEWTAEYDELTNNCNASQITQKLNTTEGIVVQFNCTSKDAPQALIQYLFTYRATAFSPIFSMPAARLTRSIMTGRQARRRMALPSPKPIAWPRAGPSKWSSAAMTTAMSRTQPLR